ncbi:hypothetical protein RB623_10200 [Mesorhizobium sp. LHD-90]|uniref:hypothetical protein n=1 Tax=Mesorhizobium sp. LHD-90 TaxID=3071414 RepID=UPI0027DF0D8F|nr:hypothetical protein [Mesorhizobium sp. LHD-90]MDQ6434419.1 hypothetical protein [Mesorhizobium sp. LHD-90]
MASTFSRFRDDVTEELEDQVARLQKEVKSLRKALGKRGASAYDGSRDMASDFYDEIAARVGDALPVIQKQSRVVKRAATDHPLTTAVIGLAVLGLLAGLLSRR